jgi:hypothetical protein
MEDWERAFREKSERRRTRARWHSIWRNSVAILAIAMIVSAGLWVANLAAGQL